MALVSIIKYAGLVTTIGVVAFGLMSLAEKSGLSWSKIRYAKEVMNYVGIVICIGRNYGIYIIVAAQDMQNSTLGVDGGSFRNNFLTNFFGDGDMATARILLHLDKEEKPDLYKVGKNGVFLLPRDACMVSQHCGRIGVPTSYDPTKKRGRSQKRSAALKVLRCWEIHPPTR